MRSLFIIILSIITLVSNAQEIKIEWKQPKKQLNGRRTLDFENSTNKYDLPYYSQNFKGENITSFTFKNEIFQNLTDSEINLLPKDFNQTEISPSIITGKSRNEWISNISFIPIVKSGGEWQKLISFEYTTTKNNTSQARTQPYDWKSTSLLNNGKWYKIAIEKTGIHKIDFEFIQTELGVDPATIDPRKIKIYGAGGAMLPQKNADTWYDDLPQNAIYIKGESDGKFGSSDYILFYAQGTTSWELGSDSTFHHELNKYSEKGYYFINLTSDGNGKRVETIPSSSGASVTLDYYDAYDAVENEDYSVVHSGRNWYGNKFDFELDKTYAFSTVGIRNNPGILVTTRLGAVSLSKTSYEVKLNNTLLGTAQVDKYGDASYPTVRINSKTWDPVETSSSTQSITLSYDKGSSSASVGYLDYIRINYLRNLSLVGNQMNFRSIESLNHTVSEFEISNTNQGIQIWDVTDITDAKSIEFTQNGTVSTFSYPTDVLKEFIVLVGSNFEKPSSASIVENQNLHALATPDFLIVTHPTFIDEANRLADHRVALDGLDVEVVNVEDIYNEFSSGKKDPSAIRNLCKMFYDRDSEKFKYVLMMGDCSYDYKDRINSNTDFVPVYESRNSESPISSHSSDDYFALLDDDEGEWCESCAFAEYLDIGVGRIPAKNVEEAKGVVDKIIHYDTEKEDIDECNDVATYQSGKWKNEVVLIADDSDNNSHFASAESIYNTMKTYNNYHVDKIYIDAYEQISGAGGQTAPDVKAEINRKMERGALIFNYSGHGGELGLSHEGVISENQIRDWDNINNMPLMFTATCEFGRYDDPERTSAGEYTLLNNKGGVVGIVTTTRPVYTSQNNSINRAFFRSVFEPVDTTTGEMPRLGDVIRNAKNGSVVANDVNNRNFALLGDPSMRLAYPKERVVLTSINNSTFTDTISDTISALQKVKMAGEIRDYNGSFISTFNGVIEVSIFDKLSTYKTLGDEKGSPADFDERDTKIFEGLATVKDGKFEYTFIVPKDIKYTFGNGQASFYASSPDLNIDANGSNLDFIVGGTSRNIENDETPPQINLFMNDESFVYGGATSESPALLAKLFDENGINTTGVGIGHEISAIMDDKSDNVVVLNDFYTSELDDYQKGIVKYPYESLTPGNHKLTVKAWDTYNNSNEEVIEFVVVNDAALALTNILNYPNPFTTNTSFHFDHNRYCDDLAVMIQVYTVSGKLIKTLQQNFPHAPAHISAINWDGKDDFGKNIGRGVYVYKVKVRSLSDGAQVQEYQKLVILK